MTEEKKEELANSFGDQFEEAPLTLSIPAEEFQMFERGIYATDMDEKWNVFIWENQVVWTRSWTDYCIFKIDFERFENNVQLTKLMVTRDSEKYKSIDLERDISIFLRVLDFYKRENSK